MGVIDGVRKSGQSIGGKKSPMRGGEGESTKIFVQIRGENPVRNEKEGRLKQR